MSDLFKNLPISRSQIKIFFCTFLAMFIIMCLHYLGVQSPFKPPQLITPLPAKAEKTDIMDTVRPKLQEKPSTFKLKKEHSFVPKAYAASGVDDASAYAVVDLETGRIISEKNGTQRIHIASLTKIMTAVVGLDLAEPSEYFTVTERAAKMQPTKLGLIPGETMTLEELLHGALLTSANDAAEEIKEGIDHKYQTDVFINAMNAKAEFLGLTDTHFTNAQGFDYGDNYSSAENLALLTHYAMTNYPLFADIVKKDFYPLPADLHHKQFDMYNWNGLVGVYPETMGVKIGNTTAAGYTTVVVSNRNGKKMLAVVLGAHGVLERDLWAAELLDRGYSETLNLEPVNITEEQLKMKYATWQYWN